MKGWKTWVGAALIAGAAVLRYFGLDAVAEAIMMIGGAFGLIGLGHKVEKASR